MSLRSLAARLTPGQVPEFTVPDEPFMDTGTEPPTYLHTVSNRVRAQDARPARAAYAPDLAARAVALLSADGRQATEQIPEPRHASWGVVVTGRRDGREITVSVARDRDTVRYLGRTPALALYAQVPHVRPEPVVTERTLLPGRSLCEECDGLGLCPLCEGRGWVLDGLPGWGGGPRDPHRLGRCPECLTQRVCPTCSGAGQY